MALIGQASGKLVPKKTSELPGLNNRKDVTPGDFVRAALTADVVFCSASDTGVALDFGRKKKLPEQV